MAPPTEKSTGQSSSALPYLRAIVDYAVEGTVLIDENQRVMLVNKTAAEMVGLAIASVIGITLDEWILKSSSFFADPRPFLAYVTRCPAAGRSRSRRTSRSRSQCARCCAGAAARSTCRAAWATSSATSTSPPRRTGSMR